MVRAAALALIVTAPAFAQSAAPAKMIIINNISNAITVTDYPSMARCERARAAYLASVASRGPGNGPGVVLPVVTLFCIQG